MPTLALTTELRMEKIARLRRDISANAAQQAQTLEEINELTLKLRAQLSIPNLSHVARLLLEAPSNSNVQSLTRSLDKLYLNPSHREFYAR